MNFESVNPKSVGIRDEWLIRFLSRLEQQGIPMHSAIIMKNNKICLEAYYHPFEKDSLHRMFSVTKSMVAMAVGLLAEEGKLSLSDHIIDYFPEKQPQQGAFPYTAMLTIKDMLEMKTCHTKTTYKSAGTTDWVGSFFTTPPSHVPGTSFAYDTSSTHVLGALVEKLSGMKLLDYMRSKCLDDLGFSKASYILTDPCGVSLGGSGLCATSRDLLILMMLVAGNGNVNGIQYIPHNFMQDARKKHSDTTANQGTLEEIQGYGYQIWLTRHGGNVLFGMGGQLALYIPDQDIYMITTADTQGRQGGVQYIYDAFFEEIYDRLTGVPTYKTPEMSLDEFTKTRNIISLCGNLSSGYSGRISHKEYICDKNVNGYETFTVSIDDDNMSGKITYKKSGVSHTIDFGLGHGIVGSFPEYGFRYTANAVWKMDNYLLIRVNIIDNDTGSLYIGMNYKDAYVTVVMRKFLEYRLNDYADVFSGRCEELA